MTGPSTCRVTAYSQLSGVMRADALELWIELGFVTKSIHPLGHSLLQFAYPVEVIVAQISANPVSISSCSKSRRSEDDVLILYAVPCLCFLVEQTYGYSISIYRVVGPVSLLELRSSCAAM